MKGDATKRSEAPAREELPGVSINIACAVLLVAILYLDLASPLGIAVPILYNAVVLLALRSADRRLIVVVALLASVLTIGPLLHKPPIDEMWKAAANRALALFTVWICCYLGVVRQTMEGKRMHALHEREKALEEVRMLRGFLPICASCKRIRDYEGSWTMIEKYISEHSEAEFSHGLCPDCTKRLFPDFPQQAKPSDGRSGK
ncbi:MAG TPA: hypothetical protein DCZ75_12805 [Geobacter sp.]|nr:hypothetical protein [Geobacter sp.]